MYLVMKKPLTPTQQDFIKSLHVESLPGKVSARCRSIDDKDAGIRHILIDGTVAFQYSRDDRYAEKLVWIQVYKCGFANQGEIAAANTFSKRSFGSWVARYHKEGSAGMIDRPAAGAKRKVTDPIRQRIYNLRDQRYKVQEIADCLHLGKRSVEYVLHNRAAAKQAAPMSLFDNQVTPETTSDSSCCADDECVPEHESQPPIRHAVGDSSSPITEPVSEFDTEHEPAFANTALGNSADNSNILERPLKSEPATAFPATFELLSDKVEDHISRNRNRERVLAHNGQLQDAPPLFHNEEHADFAGAFMAIACLASDPFLACAMQRYGQFKAAFYGTRTIFLTLLLMLMLRYNRIEHLKELCPQALGFMLGMDRSPDLKTMRRRLVELAEWGLGSELMGDLARTRHSSDTHVIYIDDHVQVYSGKRRIGKVFSNRTKQVRKGRTEQWAHSSDGIALFVIESEFNETLIDMMPEMIDRLRNILGVKRLDLVFDRGGYSGKFLAELKKSETCDFTIYRCNPYDDIPTEKLTFERTTIGKQVYICKPYDHDVEINIYDDVTSKSGKTRRMVTGTVTLREIRVVLEDHKQQAILTSHTREKVSAEDIIRRPQGRWGNQENEFKYMRENYNFDGLWSYRTELITDKNQNHPHPDYKAIEKELAVARKQRKKIHQRYGNMLLGNGATSDSEAVKRTIEKFKKQDRSKLKELEKKISLLSHKRDETPERETAEEGKFHTLWSQVRLLQNTITFTANHIEKRLASLLGDDYSRKAEEARALVATALHTSGAVHLAPGKLLVELQPQSSAQRTRAVNAICERLTALQARYPGSARVIEFIPTPVAPPPQHHRWNPRPKEAT